MKKLMILLLICIFASLLAAQTTVLFIVGAGQEATGPEEADEVVLDLLDSFGWDVEIIYLDDPSLMTEDLGLDKDLVVISSTVNSTHVGTFYFDKPVPVVTWESGMYGKLGIASGGSNIEVAETFMTIMEEGHPVVGEYTGEIEILLDSPMELTLIDTSQYSPDLIPLGEVIKDDGDPGTGLFAIETGGLLIDSTAAPARRIGFFFRDKTAVDASESALDILGLSCKWAMAGEETLVDELKSQLADYRLLQNYPNPFNPSTTITFNLAKSEDITLSIYNNIGHKVCTLHSGVMQEGQHSVKWNGLDDNGNNLASGVYYYELIANSGIMRNKMLLLK